MHGFCVPYSWCCTHVRMVHVEALWAHTQADISCCVPSTSSLRTDGHGKLPSTVPDTITTWVGQGMALSKEEGIGFSNMASLTVFKSFFVSLELPYSVNFGETMTIKPVVFNFLSRDVLVCERNPLHVHLHTQTHICRPAHTHTQHTQTRQTHYFNVRDAQAGVLMCTSSPLSAYSAAAHLPLS